LEKNMKYLALFGLLTVVLACGGTGEKPPIADEADTLAEGPGTVAAADGVPIAYTVAGSGSPVLVFIHGWMCDQTFWAAQVEAFRESNTIVTIDLPGHGLSGTEREAWSVLGLGGDVQAVVEHLNLEKVVLIGHSMGGPVVLEAGRLMPDRVIGLVAVDALHDADLEWDPEQTKALLAAFENNWVGTCAQFVVSMFPEGADPRLIEQVNAAMCDGVPEIGVALMRDFGDYELAPALAAVAVPVRYLSCDKWPTNVEANRKYRPDFDGTTMDGVGHFLMMEKPEEFNELLRKTLADFDTSRSHR
jgi:pimeloyl-ACP methyl ester carboxylesterase